MSAKLLGVLGGGLLGTLYGASLAEAGSGEIVESVGDDNGTDYPTMEVELTFTFAFPPTGAVVDLAKDQLARASQVLCDSTDGALKITKVNLRASPFSQEQADVIWYPEGTNGGGAQGKTNIPFGEPGNFLRIEGGENEEPESGIEGVVLAHEMGHSVLGLYDGYDSQRRRGNAWGFGWSVEPDELEQTRNSLMANSKGQVCYDLVSQEILPDPAGEEVRCLKDGDCVEVGGVCPASPHLTSELLTSTQFDAANAGDGGPFPGPRPGSMLNIQGWFKWDHQPEMGAASIDWTSFATFDDVAAADDFGNYHREYVDPQGELFGKYDVIDGSDEYSGSSHRIRFFAKHLDNPASEDEWRIIAYMDQREVTDTFDQVPDPDPRVLEWEYGGATHDYLDIVFDMDGTAAFNNVSLPDGEDAPVYHDADCFPVETVGGEPFDLVTGESTGGDVKLLLPIMLKDDPGPIPAEEMEVVIGKDGVFKDNLVSCRWTGTPPAKLGPKGVFAPQRWNEDTDEWTGLGFLGGARDLQQLGDCDAECIADGRLDLWNAARDRWEGARQVRDVQQIVDRLTAIPPNTYDLGNCGDNVECRELLYSGLIQNGSNDDWALLDFRARSRFDIDISHWRPASTPLSSISSTPFCADAGNITFDGEPTLGNNDTIIVLIDRSQSMKETYTYKSDTSRKIDLAKPGVAAFLEMMEGQSARVGWYAFAKEPTLLQAPVNVVDGDPDFDASEIYKDIAPALNDLQDFTSIGDALAAAVNDLENDPMVSQGAIFLLTDGRETTGDVTCEDGVQAAADAGIPIYWAPIGPYPEQPCPSAEMADNGDIEIIPISTPQMLPSRLMEAYAKFRGQDLSTPIRESSVAHALGGVPQTETFEYMVTSDAERLIIELTNISQVTSDWEPKFELRSQSGATTYTEMSGVWNLDSKKRVGLIIVDNPEPGVWELEMQAPNYSKPASEDVVIASMVDRLGARCDLAISQQDLDQEVPVVLTATTSYEGTTVAGDGVSFTGTVTRPDGVQQTILFDIDEEGVGHAEYDNFNGDYDSPYEVDVTCDVGAGAKFVPGEGGDEELPLPPAYELQEHASFVLGTDQYYMPTLSGDCDNDGYTDGEEGVLVVGNPYVSGAQMTDTDGDGTPDACDDDSDNDGRRDINEPDQDTDNDGFDDRVDRDSDDDGDIDGSDPFPEDDDLDRTYARGDFDGDGSLDEVIGDYTFNSSAGRVAVYYADDVDEVPEYISRNTGIIQGSEASGDWFGRTVAAGDIDGDGYDDLIVGAPGDDVNGSNRAGSIHVIYGSANGLVTAGGDQLIHQDSPSIAGVVEPYDYYGDRLETGDYNCDGYDDVVVGVPRENLSSGDSGVVAVIYGSSTGLSTIDNEWYQGSNGVDNYAEAYDRFGDTLKTGDFDGNGCSDLAIGVPREDWGSTSNVGYVYVMLGGLAGIHPNNGDFGFSQSTSGIPGTLEASDYMGQEFWTEDFDGDGYGDLATLVPGDGCGAGTKGFLITYGGQYQAMTTNGAQLLCLDAYQEFSW